MRPSLISLAELPEASFTFQIFGATVTRMAKERSKNTYEVIHFLNRCAQTHYKLGHFFTDVPKHIMN